MTPRKDWSNSTIGERLDHLRSLRGSEGRDKKKQRLSQNELGEKCTPPIAGGVISRLARKELTEAGYLSTIRRLADAWRVNVEWLAYGRGPVEGEIERPLFINQLSNWDSLRKEAKALGLQERMPEQYIDEAGQSAPPTWPDRPVDGEFVLGYARVHRAAHERTIAARARHEPHTLTDEEWAIWEFHYTRLGLDPPSRPVVERSGERVAIPDEPPTVRTSRVPSPPPPKSKHDRPKAS